MSTSKVAQKSGVSGYAVCIIRRFAAENTSLVSLVFLFPEPHPVLSHSGMKCDRTECDTAGKKTTKTMHINPSFSWHFLLVAFACRISISRKFFFKMRQITNHVESGVAERIRRACGRWYQFSGGGERA